MRAEGKNKTVQGWRLLTALALMLALVLGAAGCQTSDEGSGRERTAKAGTVQAGADAAEDTAEPAKSRQEPKENGGETSGGAGGGTAHAQEEGADSEGKSAGQEDGGLRVHFIDVGQADCILIQTGAEAMLVDAGKNEDGGLVTEYLRSCGVERLRYVIGTHPHEDHIGGMDEILKNFETDTLILPPKVHTTQTYMDVLRAAEECGLEITQAVRGDTFLLGNAAFTILSPQEGADYGEELNNWSVGIRLTYGENSFVMTGDAEAEAEAEIVGSGLPLRADVLKAGHHGSRTSNSDSFVEAVAPSYAVISCGKGNSYGHPDLETLETFARMGTAVFRTDEQGTIVASSDGKQITWNVSPSTTMRPGDMPGGETETADGYAPESGKKDVGADTGSRSEMQQPDTGDTAQDTTVHITETGKKYHRAGCRYLAESDQEVTLAEAKARGLEPCGVCGPPQ